MEEVQGDRDGCAAGEVERRAGMEEKLSWSLGSWWRDEGLIVEMCTGQGSAGAGLLEEED